MYNSQVNLNVFHIQPFYTSSELNVSQKGKLNSRVSVVDTE